MDVDLVCASFYIYQLGTTHVNAGKVKTTLQTLPVHYCFHTMEVYITHCFQFVPFINGK